MAYKITVMKSSPTYLDDLKTIMEILSPERSKEICYTENPQEFKFLRQGLNILVSGNSFRYPGVPGLDLNSIVNRVRQFDHSTVIIGWSDTKDEDTIKKTDGYFCVDPNLHKIIGAENYFAINALKLSPFAFPLALFLTQCEFTSRNETIEFLKREINWNVEVQKLKNLCLKV